MKRATSCSTVFGLELLRWLLLLASLCQGLAVKLLHTCGPILSGSTGLSVAEGAGRSLRVGEAGARDSRQSQAQVEEWMVAQSVR